MPCGRSWGLTERRPTPGVSRELRIGAAGLERLALHLARGEGIADVVLRQWVRRYGEPARELLRRYGRYHPGLEP